MGTVKRQWGNYQVLFKAKGYQCKILTLGVGKSISLQYHYHRSEHWLVVKGTAEVVNQKIVGISNNKPTFADDPYILYEGHSIDIAQANIHKITNIGKIPLEFVEVQLGNYLEEDDIIRIKI